MSRVVLDASVVLAILRNERADEILWRIIEGAVISTVNFSEVLARTLDDVNAVPENFLHIMGLLGRIEPFTHAHAIRAAELRSPTKPFGLSLGDRACLALALEIGAEVYTADQIWSQLDIGCKIHLIR